MIIVIHSLVRLLSLHCTTPLLTVRREDTHSQIVRMQYIYIQRKVQHGFSFPPTARICCLIQLLCVRIFLSPDFHSSCLVTFSVTPSKCQRTSLLLRRQDSNLHEYLSDFVCYAVSCRVDEHSLHQLIILPERLTNSATSRFAGCDHDSHFPLFNFKTIWSLLLSYRSHPVRNILSSTLYFYSTSILLFLL